MKASKGIQENYVELYKAGTFNVSKSRKTSEILETVYELLTFKKCHEIRWSSKL